MAQNTLAYRQTQLTDTAAPGPLLAGSHRAIALVSALLCLSMLVVPATVVGGFNIQQLAQEALNRFVLIALGAVSFGIGAAVPYREWYRHSNAIAGAAILLLVLVLLPSIGTRVYGAQRWLRLSSSIGIQPSEFAKIAMIIWTAAWCTRQILSSSNGSAMKSFTRGLLIPGMLVGMAALLILAEPNLGTAALMGFTCVLLLLICGARFLYVALMGAAFLPIVHQLVFEVPYRARRITAFLHPWDDPRDTGYQLVQSLIALGSGGITGRGLSAGPSRFLPSARNDFIFSAMGSHLGFIGCLTVIVIFIWLLWEGLRIAMRSKDIFGFALATGLTSLIGIQAVLHIAVNTGTVPTTGLVLPFVSAGGSALFFNMWAVGILVNIGSSSKNENLKDNQPWQLDYPGYEKTIRRWARKIAREITNIIFADRKGSERQ